MQKQLIAIAVSVAATIGAAQPAFAALMFTNGSFEVDTTSGFQSVDPTGWTTFRTSAPPYLINNGTYGATPYGSQFLAIGGTEDGATSYIEQTISGFTPGNTYMLTWAQSSEYTSADQLNVSFTAGSSTGSQVFTSTPYPGGSEFWFTWENFSKSFVANAASVTFHFQGTSASNYEVGVDNFQISDGSSHAVPEPGNLALFGLGVFGLVGLVASRRRRF
jgi:hypothetical protein